MIESTGHYFIYNKDSLVSGFSVNNSKSESKMAFSSSKELSYLPIIYLSKSQAKAFDEIKIENKNVNKVFFI